MKHIATLRCPEGHFKIDYETELPRDTDARAFVNDIGTPPIFAQNGNVCPECETPVEVEWHDG